MTTIQANGVTLGVEHFGDAAAPLVLLAGGTTVLSWADALCAALARGGRHVVRYDLRDSGASTTGTRSRRSPSPARGPSDPAGSTRTCPTTTGDDETAVLALDARIPALVVHGRDDPFFPVANGEALARETPHARLFVLEHAATAIPDAVAGEVAEAMLAV
jgi:pimeloyl-ACP methyl ester carboxylesterase